MARHFAAAGARGVVVNYRTNETGAQEVAAVVRAAGSQAVAHPGDITRTDDADGLIERALTEFGRLDILVNNAGMRRDGLLLRMRDADWDAVLTTNLTGTFRCTRSALRTMVRQRYGRILNISSVVGLSGNAGQANYAAAKAGLIGFSRSIAREVATRSITVNVLAPGFFRTQMTEDVPEGTREFLMDRIPMERWGEPDEVAAAATFLVCDEASYITGQVLNVDGGMVMA